MATAMKVAASMPATAAAGAVPHAGHLVATPASAAPTVTAAGHARPAAPGALLAVAGPAGAGSSGMPCAARQPRDALPGACITPPPGGAVQGAVFAAGTAGACLLAVRWRARRPPGRPGLPLPLFLCVSRT
jgi:hypothetical protein